MCVTNLKGDTDPLSDVEALGHYRELVEPEVCAHLRQTVSEAMHEPTGSA